MRISAKGRYGLAAMTHLAQCYQADMPITIISIAEKMGISKIYLEQVFSLLKRAGLVNSIKGAQGGYQLASQPQDISAYDVLAAIETSLTEETAATVAETSSLLEEAMQKQVFAKLDEAVKAALADVSLADLNQYIESKSASEELMYFI